MIADVSGKGVPAALITSALHAYLRAGIEDFVSPSALAARLNRLLYDSLVPSSFLTLAFVEVEPQQRWIRYCNCGHNPPILVRNGEPELLKASGTIVAMFPSAEFETREVPLAGGERLLLYTDGLTEAARGSGDEAEEFGIARLLKLCEGEGAGPRPWLESIERSLSEFTGRQLLEDDLTMVALQFSLQGGAR